MQLAKMLHERRLLFDGAMGTSIQSLGLSVDDFEGHPDCNEWLCITRPNLIASIHESFLEAGADVIETNSFGANPDSLDTHGLKNETYQINRTAARIARQVADDFSSADRPRWVSGSVGPGGRLPSLGQVHPTQLREGYREQIRGLIDGGVDILQIETCQDPLQIRSAMLGARDAMRGSRQVPVIVQITIQSNGAMLTGTDPHTLLHAIVPLGVDAIGLNCGSGPAGMHQPLRTLTRFSPLPVPVLPNAGLPVVKQGIVSYEMTPQKFADEMREIVQRFSPAMIGGCCGTGPGHIQALREILDLPVDQPEQEPLEPSTCSLFQYQPLRQRPAPVMIGERTNVNGSKKFRNLLREVDFGQMSAIAAAQKERGAHMIDVSLVTPGRNESEDWTRLMPLLNRECDLPVMIDSTDPDSIETALGLYGGRTVVNSVNFEQGEEPVRRFLGICKRHGAIPVCLAIDEKGMAMDAERKIAICQRWVQTAADAGFEEDSLVFDCLTFTLATGDESTRNADAEAIRAIREIRRSFPGVHLLMGVSNCSYGLNPAIRKVLNSVFLHECVLAGLDMAIVDAGKILPLHEITEDMVSTCRALIFNHKIDGVDPLERLLAMDQPELDSEHTVALTEDPIQRLRLAVIKGRNQNLDTIIERLLAQKPAREILDQILLPAMSEVGRLFDEGTLQLPFVLKSAAVMREASGLLEPHLSGGHKEAGRTFLLATVQGDIHDIGKNLTGIILRNNGQNVVDLGVGQSPEKILAGIRQHRADVLGLSALLVNSCRMIHETLLLLKDNGVSIPVVCGGAAISEQLVQTDFVPIYSRKVFYAKDAFDALKRLQEDSPDSPTAPSLEPVQETIQPLVFDHSIPQVPDTDTLHENHPSLAQLRSFLNRKFLFHSLWRLSAKSLREIESAAKEMEDCLEHFFEIGKDILHPFARYGFYAVCSDDQNLRIRTRHSPNKEIQLRFPRSGPGGRCIADFFHPCDGKPDIAAFQLVTLGSDAEDFEERLHREDDYYQYFLWHGFCAAMTEALAALTHRTIRLAMKIEEEAQWSPAIDFAGRYRGIRYAFGYRCCPDLAEQTKVLELLQAPEAGIHQIDAGLMHPRYSACAIVVHHPQAGFW